MYNYNKHYNLILKLRNTGNKIRNFSCYALWNIEEHKIIVVIHAAKRIFANLIQSNKISFVVHSLIFIFRRIPFVSSYRDFESNETINFVL